MTDASQRYGYGGDGTRPFDLSDTSMTDGAFFELGTPVAPSHDDEQAFSEVDVDSEMNSVRSSSRKNGERLEDGDGAHAMRPRPEIVLRWKRFLAALFASVALVVGLTLWFHMGILVRTISEPVGDSAESERLLRRYNTFSGVSMGIFEAFLGLGFAHFFPAFTVYVHNLKWWPGDDPNVRTSKTKKVLLLLFFPLVMIAVGNSFSALQANASTVRLEVTMNSTGLMNNVSAFEMADVGALVNASWFEYHEDTILKSAVLRQVTPFAFVNSSCTQDIVKRGEDDGYSAYKRMTDIDSTSAVFGFPLKEWSREVYPYADAKFSNASLDLDTSFELLFQGQAFLERSIASLPEQRCRYFVANNTRLCRKRARRTMLDQLYGYANGTKTKSAATLKKEVIAGMQNAFFGDLDETVETTIYYQSLNVNPQIRVQMMSIPMMLAKDYEFGFPNETTVSPKGCKGAACEYQYNMVDMDAFCGETSCVIPDWHAETIPRKQASMMQYKKNCKENDAKYDPNLKTVVPGGCKDVENAVFFAGFGSRLFLDTLAWGKNATTGESSYPYAKNPRRSVTLTFGKLEWTYESLAKPFGDATCTAGNGVECSGLMHKLNPSGRYVLLGKDFVPKAIAKSDFRQPISLFQLLQPAILSPRAEHAVVVPEYIDSYSLRTKNGTTRLAIAKFNFVCSALVDAYMTHVAENNYYLYATYQPMYMSALLYIFQDAAVTRIRTTGLAANQLRLVGDRAVHKILIKNTDVGVYTIWTGCIILVVLAVVVLLFPNERARLKPMAGKNARAERFVAVQTEEVYPNLVYMKRFRIGKTGEALKLSEFAVESVSLHHQMDDDEQVEL